MQNIEKIWVYNELCVTLKNVTYQFLGSGGITFMCRLPNVQVMGIGPSTFLLQHRFQCYKQVNMKKLMEREKDYIITASGSFGCDHPHRSGAMAPFSIVCVSSARRGL
jgi:hypothetical protein